MRAVKKGGGDSDAGLSMNFCQDIIRPSSAIGYSIQLEEQRWFKFLGKVTYAG